MDDQARAEEDPAPMQCERPEEDREKRTDAPVNDERTLEEAGYGYGV